MHESLPLLTVALRGVGIDAVSDVLEEGLEVAIVGHVLLQLSEPVAVGFEMIVVIVVQEIGVYLFAYHLVGNGKLWLAPMETADSHQPEIVEQTDEVVIFGNVFCGESLLQLSRHIAL